MIKLLFGLGGMLVVALTPTLMFAADMPQHKTVGGIEVYYGVVPAEIVKRHTSQHGEAPMHGSVRVKSGTHHLVVTLYDAKTSQRIVDADVSVTVMPLGLSHEKRPLEVMKINDTISYGNYFSMPPSEMPYRILITIARPSPHTSTSAEFEYRHGNGR